jgi:hypothetical protein
MTLYAQIDRGAIDARKVGRALIIRTSPEAYFASLPRRPVRQVRRPKAAA